jgi:hypothetical protein
MHMYIFPFIDTLFEIYTYKMSEIATASKIKAETMAREYEKKYPEEEETSTNVIGYQYESPEEYYEEDDIEDCKNKIGFKIK